MTFLKTTWNDNQGAEFICFAGTIATYSFVTFRYANATHHVPIAFLHLFKSVYGTVFYFLFLALQFVLPSRKQ